MTRLVSVTIFIILNTISISATSISCPRHIRKFQAYPYNDVEKRLFFYDCSKGENVAQLRKCEDGKIYNSGLEKCIDNDRNDYIEEPRRYKRNINQQPTQATNTDSIVVQPTLGRSVRLGALYYGSTDRISVSEHLWNTETLENAFIEKRPSSHTETKISENTLDRLNNFKIDASLGLSFMGGLIEVSGHAKYLNDRKKSTHSLSMAHISNAYTSTESITTDMYSQLDYPDLCKNVGSRHGPTHVVSSIKRGFKSIFNFHLEKSTDYSQTDVEGHLMAKIANLPSLKIDAKVELKMSETETITGEKIKCSFFGDTILDSSPTNFNDAIAIYKSMSKLARASTSAISFEAQPIDKFCSGKEVILNKLSDNNIKNLEKALQQMEETELEAMTLLRTKGAITYGQSLGRIVQLYVKALRNYMNNWKQKLIEILPKVRAGSAAELKLMELLNDYEQSPFEFSEASLFLQNRRREIETVEIGLDMIKTDGIKGIEIEASGNAEGNKCLYLKSSYSVIHVLPVLPVVNIVDQYLESFNRTISTSPNQTNNIWSEREKWFWNQFEVTQAGLSFKDFINFRKWNNDRQDICFLLKLVKEQQGNQTAHNKLHKKGQLTGDNGYFRVPTKIPTPDNFDVSATMIKFHLLYEADSITTELNITYKKIVALHDNQTLREVPQQHTFKLPISENGSTEVLINDLDPHTLYVLTASAGSDAGHGPETEFELATSAFSAPANMKIKETTADSLQISWEKPLNIVSNISIDSYKVAVYPLNNTEPIKVLEIEVNNPGQNAYDTFIRNLNDAETYKVIVTPENDDIRHPANVKLQNMASLHGTTSPPRLSPPSIVDRGHHNISVVWEPPSKIAYGASIRDYVIRYERIDPRSGAILLNGSQQLLKSLGPEIVIPGLASGATYRVAVMVRTTMGDSNYSPSAIDKTILVTVSELDRFRDSLNLNAIENKITSQGNEIDRIRNDNLNAMENKIASQGNDIDRIRNDVSSQISSLNNVKNDLAILKDTAVTTMFAAQRTGAGGYIPTGTIKFDTEFVDASNVFDFFTRGQFKVKTRGHYVFSFCARISSSKNGRVNMYINGVKKHVFYHYDDNLSWRQMNFMVVESLDVGDVITLENYYANSIYAVPSNPMTLVVYKI